MASKNSLLPIFALVLFSIGGIAAQNISCYECAPVSLPISPVAQCTDPMGSNVSQLDCPKASGCYRYTFSFAQATLIGRGCNSQNASCEDLQTTMNTTMPGIGSFNCYTCSTDRCNSGIALGVTLSAVLAGIVAARFL